ncbi:hypothetical protein D3C81_970480 [compost metagenome]
MAKMRRQLGLANAQAMNDFAKNHKASVPIQTPHHHFAHHQTNLLMQRTFSHLPFLRIRQRISLQITAPKLPDAIEPFHFLKQSEIQDLMESRCSTAVSLPYKKNAAS